MLMLKFSIPLLASLLAPCAVSVAAEDPPPPAEAAGTNPPPPVEPATEEAEGPVNVVSTLPLQIYGYLMADTYYNTSEMNAGSFARWVEPDGDGNSQFGISARQTRVGLKVEGPHGNTVQSHGRVEIDFYAGEIENSANDRLRLAYVQLDFGEQDFSLLAGQTHDVISPSVPRTVNYTVAWWAGNIGFRHNQFRVTKRLEAGSADIELVGAATRTVDSEDNGNPGAQARISSHFPGLAGRPTTLEISGHRSKESGARSWSLDLGWEIPLAERFAFKGGWFTGTNLASYNGGINQGVSMGEAVRASGYWLQGHYICSKDLEFYAGVSRDNPANEYLEPDLGRTENRYAWANVWYRIDRATSLAFEVNHLATSYKDAATERGFSYQFALILYF